MIRTRTGLCAVAVIALLTSTPGLAPPAAADPEKPRTVASRPVPTLRVSVLTDGLQNPWDVAQIGRRKFLVTERDSRRLSLVSRGNRTSVRFPRRKVWASFETGLMSVVAAPRFHVRRTFYTCSGWRTRSGKEIQVRRWRLTRNGRRAIAEGLVLGGIPTDYGRHGGCRLLVDPGNGDLWVGTGDAAHAGYPRNLDVLAGKVLRLSADGEPHPDNPWADAAGDRRYVWSYGHRNVQGLAQVSPGGEVWSVEHGSDRDDEINHGVRGGDFGWEPGPGYDESVPMTDQALPGRQIEAAWSSGRPTLATSGVTWVRGRAWGALNGTLAVAALKAERLIFFTFAQGRFVRARAPRALRHRYGRLRSVHQARNGDLLVTTDNGRADRVLRISPR